MTEAHPDSEKLYVRITCSICFGSRNNRNGRSCPYCDSTGKHFIEASFREIKIQLQKLPEEDRLELMKVLKSND